jgi:hypothetical protein
MQFGDGSGQLQPALTQEAREVYRELVSKKRAPVSKVESTLEQVLGEKDLLSKQNILFKSLQKLDLSKADAYTSLRWWQRLTAAGAPIEPRALRNLLMICIVRPSSLHKNIYREVIAIASQLPRELVHARALNLLLQLCISSKDIKTPVELLHKHGDGPIDVCFPNLQSLGMLIELSRSGKNITMARKTFDLLGISLNLTTSESQPSDANSQRLDVYRLFFRALIEADELEEAVTLFLATSKTDGVGAGINIHEGCLTTILSGLGHSRRQSIHTDLIADIYNTAHDMGGHSSLYVKSKVASLTTAALLAQGSSQDHIQSTMKAFFLSQAGQACTDLDIGPIVSRAASLGWPIQQIRHVLGDLNPQVVSSSERLVDFVGFAHEPAMMGYYSGLHCARLLETYVAIYPRLGQWKEGRPGHASSKIFNLLLASIKFLGNLGDDEMGNVETLELNLEKESQESIISEDDRMRHSSTVWDQLKFDILARVSAAVGGAPMHESADPVLVSSSLDLARMFGDFSFAKELWTAAGGVNAYISDAGLGHRLINGRCVRAYLRTMGCVGLLSTAHIAKISGILSERSQAGDALCNPSYIGNHGTSYEEVIEYRKLVAFLSQQVRNERIFDNRSHERRGRTMLERRTIDECIIAACRLGGFEEAQRSMTAMFGPILIPTESSESEQPCQPTRQQLSLLPSRVARSCMLLSLEKKWRDWQVTSTSYVEGIDSINAQLGFLLRILLLLPAENKGESSAFCTASLSRVSEWATVIALALSRGEARLAATVLAVMSQTASTSTQHPTEIPTPLDSTLLEIPPSFLGGRPRSGMELAQKFSPQDVTVAMDLAVFGSVYGTVPLVPDSASGARVSLLHSARELSSLPFRQTSTFEESILEAVVRSIPANHRLLSSDRRITCSLNDVINMLELCQPSGEAARKSGVTPVCSAGVSSPCSHSFILPSTWSRPIHGHLTP